MPGKGKFRLLPGWRGSTASCSSSAPPPQYGFAETSEEDARPQLETLASFCGDVPEDDSSPSASEEDVTPREVQRPRRHAISAEATGVWNPRRAGKMPPTFEKSPEHEKALRTALKACPFFRGLDAETMNLLVDVMPIEQDVPEGKKIIQQGDVGDSAFVLLSGSCYVCDEDGHHQIYSQKTVEVDTTRVTGELQRITEDRKEADGSPSRRKGKMGTMAAGRFFGEIAMLWGCMRTVSVFAREACVLAKLDREAYTNVVILRSIAARNMRTECLRRAKLLETLQDEDITLLADALEQKDFKEGEAIIEQGSWGYEFFVVQKGECSASVRTGVDNGSPDSTDVQEHRRYGPGELFGERALLQRTYRAATVKALVPTEVLVLSRRKFERLLGSLETLSAENYLTDPRKSIADFYRQGDGAGPSGSRAFNPEVANMVAYGAQTKTDWFAVYRPTSRDAISKMLSGNAVGKGLNVKGKSAKGGRLSGYVPFLQIHENMHKQDIEDSPPDARVKVYYQTEIARQEALAELQKVVGEAKSDLLAPPGADGAEAKKAAGRLNKAGASPASQQRRLSPCPASSGGASSEQRRPSQQRRPSPVPGKSAKAKSRKPPKTAAPKESKEPQDAEVRVLDDYKGMYGLDMPEHVLREVYIEKPDLSFLAGWETGRNSEPAFMDMNLHAIRDHSSQPTVVLIQIDGANPLNPQGLLIAYAEEFVKPVVSDFDTFLVGSRGMIYEELTEEQGKLASWTLDNTLAILNSPDNQTWNSRWLEVLKKADEEGFHPAVPKFGFGDNASYRLTTEVIQATLDCGAVRHGAECFNFFFPQELDEEYLVVWEHFPDKPWNYLTEEPLRHFLLDRVAEGFSFPLNPVWPVRDPGWYEVFEALQGKLEAAINLTKWFPQESGLMAKMESIHRKFPAGFRRKEKMLKKTTTLDTAQTLQQIPSMVKVTHLLDLNARERADFVSHKKNNPQALLKAATKLDDVFENPCISNHL